MEPSFLGQEQWRQIGHLLTFLWGVLAMVVGFAFTFLVAQALIPSLVHTRHLPPAVLRLRPFLFLAAFSALALAFLFLSRAVGLAGVIGTFYRRWWF